MPRTLALALVLLHFMPAMAAGDPSADSAEQTGGTITGTVTASDTSTPLANVAVLIVTITDGTVVNAGYAVTLDNGTFSASGLPTGTYYAHTNIGGRGTHRDYVDEIYDGVQCTPGCFTVAEGYAGATPIPVTSGTVAAGHDFRLERGGFIAGMVTSAATSAPLASAVYVQLFRRSTSGAPMFVNHTGSSELGSGYYEMFGLPADAYHVQTIHAGLLSRKKVYRRDLRRYPMFGAMRSAEHRDRGYTHQHHRYEWGNC